MVVPTATTKVRIRQLMVNRVSDNVGYVKRFSSTREHALKEERHFALVKSFTFSNPGSLAISFQVRNSVRPMHLFGLLVRS